MFGIEEEGSPVLRCFTVLKGADQEVFDITPQKLYKFKKS